jgi:hypothetical protein
MRVFRDSDFHNPSTHHSALTDDDQVLISQRKRLDLRAPLVDCVHQADSTVCKLLNLRGAPQLGFSATMRNISSRNSVLTRLRPARLRCRESHVQLSLKPLRLPPNHGRRLDKNQCPLPAGPMPPQHHPEQLVAHRKSRMRMRSLENAELLPKSRVFQDQIAARANQSRKEDNHEPQQA